jgi:hypothetical protein
MGEKEHWGLCLYIVHGKLNYGTENKDDIVFKKSAVIYTLLQRVVSQYTGLDDWRFESHQGMNSTVSHQQILGALSQRVKRLGCKV